MSGATLRKKWEATLRSWPGQPIADCQLQVEKLRRRLKLRDSFGTSVPPVSRAQQSRDLRMMAMFCERRYCQAKNQTQLIDENKAEVLSYFSKLVSKMQRVILNTPPETACGRRSCYRHGLNTVAENYKVNQRSALVLAAVTEIHRRDAQNHQLIRRVEDDAIQHSIQLRRMHAHTEQTVQLRRALASAPREGTQNRSMLETTRTQLVTPIRGLAMQRERTNENQQRYRSILTFP